MRPVFLLLALAVALPWSVSASGVVTRPASATQFDLPLRFESHGNAGYAARGFGYDMTIRPSAGVSAVVASSRFDIRFTGANRSPRLAGQDLQPGATNYLVGNRPEDWRLNVPSYSRVLCEGIYDGIDVVYYGKEGRLEFDFVVHPGADPSRIRLAFDGASRLEIDRSGDLILHAGGAPVRLRKPVLYQQKQGRRLEVAGGFRLRGAEVSFATDEYDRSLPLVIDPVLSFSTYHGGAHNEAARAIALDKNGNIYIAGFTASSNFPTTTPYQSVYAGPAPQKFIAGDAFVMKLNAAGTAVVYSTYIGGSLSDSALGLAVDSSGSAHVVGYTDSTNFPTTTNAFQKTYQGGGDNTFVTAGDGFAAKLNAQGNGMVYCTYLGGSKDDRAIAVALDNDGYAYIAGVTMSTNFPVSASALQKTYAGAGGNKSMDGTSAPMYQSGDAFVAKLSPTGNQLPLATYLGGKLDEAPSAIALDASGAIYVAGGTLSSDFPTTAGAYQRTYKGYASEGFDWARMGDAFAAKLKPDMSALLFSTYLGGARNDAALGMAVGNDGSVHLTGATTSTDFPVSDGAFQTKFGGATTANEMLWGDAFYARIKSDGSGLLYSTYLGGKQDDAGWGLAVDPWGGIVIAGHTLSTDFPVTSDAAQKTFLGQDGDASILLGDAFLARFAPGAKQLSYATYYGGARDEVASALAIDSAGNAYITGFTYSQTLVGTTNAPQKVLGGGVANQAFPPGDAFVAKFSSVFDPGPSIAAIANAANYEQAKVSAGELVVLFGDWIGPASLTKGTVNANQRVETLAGETRFLFDGVAAPIIYVSKTQSSVVVPYAVAGKTSTTVQAEYKGALSAPVAVPVVAVVPGLFSANASGTGQGAILNQDYSVNSAANAADQESVVMLYGTGEGQTNPAGVDGQVAMASFPVPVTQPVTATVGGLTAEVQYAGAAPYMVAGVIQVNVKLPKGLASGSHDVVVTIGTTKSQTGLKVAVK